MPRKEIDYSKTIIYKITCNDETVDYTYVGHTTDFTNRKYGHKINCSNEKSSSYHLKLYKTIREYGGWNNWTMSEIACYDCNNVTEARIKEQQHYELLKANLNCVPPYVEPKQKVKCEICNIYCNNENELINHNETNKHKNKITNNAVMTKDDEKMPKKSVKFICECCDFKCSKESNYRTHLLTAKHKKMTKNAKPYICECGKEYNHRQGLWSHKKKCNIETKENNELIEIKSESEVKELKEMVKDLLKQNTELVQTIKEMTPKIGNTTIHNNNNNNCTTNNFNLNMFLNETCKDAINLSDFIKTIKFTESDLKNTRLHGGISTLSNVMIKGLQQLDITKRPVHCTDIKRETLYIKDNEKWEKDENHKKMMEAFGDIAEKQREGLWEWSDANPETQNVYHPLNDVFHHTNVKVLDPINKKEEQGKKFIRNVSKEILIDKKQIE